MKHSSLVALLLHLFSCNLVFALLSPKQLEIFSVFVKPYGISFKDDLILNVSRKLEKCTAFNATFKECNSVFVNLTSSTTGSELSKLESLSKKCPGGSYGCFYNTVKSDQVLQGWFIRMRSAFKGLCKEHAQCWQTLAKVVNKCIQVTQSGIETSLAWLNLPGEVIPTQHTSRELRDSYSTGQIDPISVRGAWNEDLWLDCGDLPAMGTVFCLGWLAAVEAPGYSKHPPPTYNQSHTKKPEDSGYKIDLQYLE